MIQLTHRWTQSGHFFQKQNIFFNFLKRAGGSPFPSPSFLATGIISVATLSYVHSMFSLSFLSELNFNSLISAYLQIELVLSRSSTGFNSMYIQVINFCGKLFLWRKILNILREKIFTNDKNSSYFWELISVDRPFYDIVGNTFDNIWQYFRG